MVRGHYTVWSPIKKTDAKLIGAPSVNAFKGRLDKH